MQTWSIIEVYFKYTWWKVLSRSLLHKLCTLLLLAFFPAKIELYFKYTSVL